VIEPGDRVIVLSTCLRGDDSHRYLVMAVLNDDI
jgi:sortase (surface protein transpeptidase)